MRGAARGSADASRIRPRLSGRSTTSAAAEAVGIRLRERRQIGARLEQRRGDEQKLHVGHRLRRIAFEECHGPARQVGGDAGAEDEGLGKLKAMRSSRIFCWSGPRSAAP